MLFLVEATVKSENRVAKWNTFGNMPLEDHQKLAGDKVTYLGRWHHLTGDGATALLESDSAEAVAALCMRWTPFSDARVIPVMEDDSMMKVVQGLPSFVKK